VVEDYRTHGGLDVLAAMFALDELPLEGSFIVEGLDFWLEVFTTTAAKAVVRMSLDDMRAVERLLDDAVLAGGGLGSPPAAPSRQRGAALRARPPLGEPPEEHAGRGPSSVLAGGGLGSPPATPSRQRGAALRARPPLGEPPEEHAGRGPIDAAVAAEMALQDELARLSGSVLFRMLNNSTYSLRLRLVRDLHETEDVSAALAEMKQMLRAAAFARPAEEVIRARLLDALKRLTAKLRERLIFGEAKAVARRGATQTRAAAVRSPTPARAKARSASTPSRPRKKRTTR
ncbi:MAG: hypothetical protein IT379_29955, partial [Deltaproteobacteria bacterium]|nr:hypothetical protein [Deltaproteobacteria bacterium]